MKRYILLLLIPLFVNCLEADGDETQGMYIGALYCPCVPTQEEAEIFAGSQLYDQNPGYEFTVTLERQVFARTIGGLTYWIVSGYYWDPLVVDPHKSWKPASSLEKGKSK